MSGRRKLRETESYIPTAVTPLLEVDTFLSLTGTMLILPLTPNDVLFFQIIPLFLSHIPHYSFCSFGLPASLSSNFLSSTLCVSSCFMSLSSFSSHYSRNYYFCVTPGISFHSIVNTSISPYSTHQSIPDHTAKFDYISLLVIPCIIYYVTNKETLTLKCPYVKVFNVCYLCVVHTLSLMRPLIRL